MARLLSMQQNMCEESIHKHIFAQVLIIAWHLNGKSSQANSDRCDNDTDTTDNHPKARPRNNQQDTESLGWYRLYCNDVVRIKHDILHTVPIPSTFKHNIHILFPICHEWQVKFDSSPNSIVTKLLSNFNKRNNKSWRTTGEKRKQN